MKNDSHKGRIFSSKAHKKMQGVCNIFVFQKRSCICKETFKQNP